MRKLLGLLVVLAVLFGIFSIIDVVVRLGVQGAIADRIESRSPGSHADVKISSFPFLGHLALSGTVPSMDADVTDVTDGDLHFSRIDLHVTDLEVERGQLDDGTVQPVSIERGRVVAYLSQSSVDALAHVPLRLGNGTVELDGVTAPVTLTVTDGAVVVTVAQGLPSFSVPVPDLDILPCVGAARVVPGSLHVSCRFTTLPGLLADAHFHF